jgi:hypothetical protein
MDRQPLTDRLGDKLLAEYGGAAAAYSLRSLSGDQTKVVRVRRSSDNAEKDFTASEMGAALEDWVAEEQAGWNVQPTWDVNTGDASITSQSSTETTSTVSFITTSGVSGIRQSSKPNHIVASSGDNVEINLDVSGLENDMRLRLSPSGSNVASITFENISNGYNQTFSGTLIEDAGYIRFLDLDATSGATITINSVKVTGKTGFVETWYDQSGNGNDATQTVAVRQPKIVDGGVLVSGGIDFDGTDDFLETNNSDLCNISELSLFTVLTGIKPTSRDIAVSAGSVVPASTAYGGWVLGFDQAAGARLLTQALGSSAISTANKNFSPGEHLVTSILNVPNGTTSVDSVEGTTNTSMIEPYNNNIGRRKLRIGCQYTFQVDRHYSAPIKEVIIYSSDQSANRAAIETNINNHYDIY